jgi:NADH:ubiquinone oxidoreductase subunit E
MWDIKEAAQYYRSCGAPGDQAALVSFLREVQENFGGRIPGPMLSQLAEQMGVKESFLVAVIRRIPSLRLSDMHTLELCGGPNCGKHAALAAAAEKLCKGKNVTLKFVPCMRLCGKGPNLKWDGTLYHKADEALIKRLLEQK